MLRGVMVLIEHGQTAAMNLGLNDAILEAVAAGHPPVVRVYNFRDPAVILAYNEDRWDVKSRELPVYRRPTGGSVVLADQHTLGYSVYAPSNGHLENVHATYRQFTLPVARALRDLGVPDVGIGNLFSIRSKGKVIAGHAQRRISGAFEYQGLIRLRPWDVTLLDRVIRLRELCSDGNGKRYLRVEGQVFDLDGRPLENHGGAELQVVRREHDEIATMPGVLDYGIELEQLERSIAGALAGEGFHQGELNSRIRHRAYVLSIDRHSNELWVKGGISSLQRNLQRGLGHCFVDMLEPETAVELV